MIISNAYQFVMLFDVENGNPNGDPDAGNTPRIDPETGHGFITDVCLKRKIRNYVDIVKEDEAGYNILVKTDKPLNVKFTEAYEELELKQGEKGKNTDDVKKAQQYICKNYFDVRAFGAVMSTGENPCGIVRGPVQINFAKSISPIYISDISITRQAVTKEKEGTKGTTEMGRKSIIPYALYRAEGYISASLAQKVTGLCENDLELLWTSIINMFEEDRSAARGKMCMRKLFVFKHENILGNCPSHLLFDKISINQIGDVPRAFGDYEVKVDSVMPEGVELISKI